MRRFSKFIFILILLLGLGLTQASFAQVPNDIQKLIDHSAFQNGLLSISAIDVESDEIVVDYQSNIALIPASSLKLITTFSALHYLGDDFKYKTEVYLSGDVDSFGTLQGDVVIVGSGDPTLGSPDEKGPTIHMIYERTYQALNEYGISCISGKVVADATIFSEWAIHDTWSWDDLCNYYASGAYGINIHENYFNLSFSRSSVPNVMTSIESIEPSIGQLKVKNEVITGAKGSGDRAYFYGDPYSYDRSVRGSIPPGQGSFKIKGAIPNPPLYFINGLNEYLAIKGIQSSGVDVVLEQLNPNDRKLLFRVISPGIKSIVKRANFESNNLYCESLLHTIGAKLNRPANFEDGIDQVESYLMSSGLSKKELQMKDGSGLSPFNRVTTNLMSRFVKLQIKKFGIDAFTKYLPKAGYEGTVKGMLKNKPAKGSVWLKSGSISGVLSYTGVIKAKSGKAIAICIISNGHTSRNSTLRPPIEKILNNLYLDN